MTAPRMCINHLQSQALVPHVTLLVESSHAETTFIHYDQDNSVYRNGLSHSSSKIAVYFGREH